MVLPAVNPAIFVSPLFASVAVTFIVCVFTASAVLLGSAVSVGTPLSIVVISIVLSAPGLFDSSSGLTFIV